MLQEALGQADGTGVAGKRGGRRVVRRRGDGTRARGARLGEVLPRDVLRACVLVTCSACCRGCLSCGPAPAPSSGPIVPTWPTPAPPAGRRPRRAQPRPAVPRGLRPRRSGLCHRVRHARRHRGRGRPLCYGVHVAASRSRFGGGGMYLFGI